MVKSDNWVWSNRAGGTLHVGPVFTIRHDSAVSIRVSHPWTLHVLNHPRMCTHIAMSRTPRPPWGTDGTITWPHVISFAQSSLC